MQDRRAKTLVAASAPDRLEDQEDDKANEDQYDYDWRVSVHTTSQKWSGPRAVRGCS